MSDVQGVLVAWGLAGMGLFGRSWFQAPPTRPLQVPQTIHCPTCATPTKYSLQCAWHYCWVCDRGLGDEVIYSRSRTRQGRLWLAIFTR